MIETRRRNIDREAPIPIEYQQVEYLQSTGSNWILTDVKGYASTIGIKVYFAEGGFSNYSMGAAYGSARGIGLNPSVYNLNYYSAAGLGYIRLSNFGIASDADLFSVEANYLNSGNIKANDIIVADGKTFGGANYYITIFAFNLETYISNRTGSGKITRAEITDGSEIIRKFIPCYRKSDLVAGMYERMNGVFYTNAGTGTFIAGPDIN